MKSLGFVEVSGVVAAVDALDIMCKTSNVKLAAWERKLGGRLVTVIIEGSVSDVTEAVENAKQKCVGRVRASNVIANPHEETARLVSLSAARLAKKNSANDEPSEPEKSVQTKKTMARKPKTNNKNS